MKHPVHDGELIAIGDLGSNSFHLWIVLMTRDDPTVLDRLRATVRLADGVDRKGRLAPEYEKAALYVLEGFGRLLRRMAIDRVRIVGTKSFRSMQGKRRFLNRAERAIGFPIEILTGWDEAKLTYLGVSREIPFFMKRKLVVDVGGGSTEIAIGEGNIPEFCKSVDLGYLNLVRSYDEANDSQPDRFDHCASLFKTRLGAVDTVKESTRWDAAVGASGVIRRVGEVTELCGIGGASISSESVQRLTELLLERRPAWMNSGIDMPNTPARELAALAILQTIMTEFEIDELHISKSGLREGLLYDFVDKLTWE